MAAEISAPGPCGYDHPARRIEGSGREAMLETEAFRSEIRAWLEAEAPSSLRGFVSTDEGGGVWGGRRAVYDPPETKAWLEMMAERGFTAPSWPREYGGAGLSPAEAKVLREEIARQKLPAPLVGFGLEILGARCGIRPRVAADPSRP
jgi:alkylation response protein AidB-like acyl-CoA dehydrogenase